MYNIYTRYTPLQDVETIKPFNKGRHVQTPGQQPSSPPLCFYHGYPSFSGLL